MSEDHVKEILKTFFLESINANAKCIDEDKIMSCNKDISIEEVRFGISKLKDNKSPGINGLVNKLYKEFQK